MSARRTVAALTAAAAGSLTMAAAAGGSEPHIVCPLVITCCPVPVGAAPSP